MKAQRKLVIRPDEHISITKNVWSNKISKQSQTTEYNKAVTLDRLLQTYHRRIKVELIGTNSEV